MKPAGHTAPGPRFGGPPPRRAGSAVRSAGAGLAALLLLAAGASTGQVRSEYGGAPVYRVSVLASYPHATDAFTQGLLVHSGELIESTGQYGRSTLRRVELETGEVLQKVELDADLFAEGCTVVGDRIVQLTWRSGLGLVYDLKSFERVETFHYDHEGWGIAFDGTHLVVSDGSATLRLLDPESYEEVERILVTSEEGPVEGINELEMVRGELFANLWPTNALVRIDLATGAVTGWIHLGALLDPAERTGEEDVVNGIAWDEATQRLFVTGKNWPRLFELELIPPY